MYPIEALPDVLRNQSKNKRYIVLNENVVLEAVNRLAELQWAVRQCAVKNSLDHTAYRDMYRPAPSLSSLFVPWHHGESWSDYVSRSAARVAQAIQTLRTLYAQTQHGDDAPIYFLIDAIQENSYLEKIQAILATYFAENLTLDVTEATTTLPLVAALVQKSTRSFSHGQRIYVYNAHWGMDEVAMVVGRYRRTGRWICGHCPMHVLDNFRPKIIYDPQILRKLREQTTAGQYGVSQSIFFRFFAMPSTRDSDQ